MTDGRDHIIKNAVLDFHFNTNEDGFVLQGSVRSWLDELMPQLEEAFSLEDEPGRIISIDELSFDLEFTGANWRAEANRQLSAQVRDKLKSFRSATPPGSIRGLSGQQHFGDIFLHFLQHGYLPWNAPRNIIAQWTDQAQGIAERPPAGFPGKLLNLLSAAAFIRERFIRTLPFHAALSLFATHIAQLPELPQQLAGDLSLLATSAVADTFLSEKIYRIFLSIVTGSEGEAQIEQLLRAGRRQPDLFNLIQASDEMFQSRTFREIQNVRSDSAAPKDRGRQILPVNEEDVNDEQAEENARQRPPKKRGESDRDKNAGQDKQLQKEQRARLEEGIFLSNAGLVIMAAFLPALFRKTGLAGEDAITDLDAAVCLTQYLGTGTQQMEEYELALPKVLCGLDVGQLIDPKAFHLNAQLEAEAGELLDAVIGHWKILGNTSAEGLRASFLQRSGRLSFNENAWLLQVEQQPYDMLLQHLPWNIRMIRLPWMKHVLKTEWIG